MKMSEEIERTVLGVGYMGVGLHVSRIFGKVTEPYAYWQGMMERCYCKKTLQKRPTYIGCSVTSEWHNYQTFADWFMTNFKSGFVLDKDILIKGNKIYSPDTCLFVPKEINSMFISNRPKPSNLPRGVRSRSNKYESRLSIKGIGKHLGTFDAPELAFQAYKEHKEAHIKSEAERLKKDLSPDAYIALMNYIVEITD